MHPSITPLASIFRLNTELVLNCIEDLDDERAQERGDPPVNSITFLVAHLTETRHLMARLMGQPLPSPFSQAFGKARTLDEAGPLPSLDDVRGHWERISAHVAVHISGSTPPSWLSRRPKSCPVRTARCSAPWHSWPSMRVIIWVRSGFSVASEVAPRCSTV